MLPKSHKVSIKDENKEMPEGKTILSLGEFGLIKHLTTGFENKNASTIKGVGDDAAVIKCGKKLSLITTDLLVEGIHFNLVYTPMKHLGYKSIVVNLSDIAAMNGTPEQVTVSLALSSKISLEQLEDFYQGVKLACERYHVDLIGGDTTTSLTGVTISVTAIGSVDKGKEVYRTGAQSTDVICVSGDLGGAYLGLQLLERERKVFEIDPYSQPQLIGYDYILERQLKPEARLDIIKALAESGVKPSAMIDISDGLSSELLHICESSNVGCRIYEDRLPVNLVSKKMCEEINMDPSLAALNGGEDYELLFTISLADYELIKEIKDIQVIGYITPKEEGAFMFARNNAEVKLIAQGWNPISKSN